MAKNTQGVSLLGTDPQRRVKTPKRVTTYREGVVSRDDSND